jgi:hypothetical protein
MGKESTNGGAVDTKGTSILIYGRRVKENECEGVLYMYGWVEERAVGYLEKRNE